MRATVPQDHLSSTTQNGSQRAEGSGRHTCMPSTVETNVARCGSCSDVVPIAGNTIRLWGGNPSRVVDDGQIALEPAPVAELLLVCPSCRSRTRITHLL